MKALNTELILIFLYCFCMRRDDPLDILHNLYIRTNQLTIRVGSYSKFRVSQKRRQFTKLKNFTTVLSDDREGKIIELSTLNIFAIGRTLWETLYHNANHASKSTIIGQKCYFRIPADYFSDIHTRKIFPDFFLMFLYLKKVM